MPGLAVVNAPAVGGVGEGLLEVDRVGPADSYFDELAFVDEQFEVVPTTLAEYFSADGGFEAAAFLGGADEEILIKF